jgi:hypothetical protein
MRTVLVVLLLAGAALGQDPKPAPDLTISPAFQQKAIYTLGAIEDLHVLFAASDRRIEWHSGRLGERQRVLREAIHTEGERALFRSIDIISAMVTVGVYEGPYHKVGRTYFDDATIDACRELVMIAFDTGKLDPAVVEKSDCETRYQQFKATRKYAPKPKEKKKDG